MQQMAQHVMHPFSRLDAWPAEAPYNDRHSRLVFIVRDIPQSMIEQAFALFCGAHDVLVQDAGRRQNEL